VQAAAGGGGGFIPLPQASRAWPFLFGGKGGRHRMGTPAETWGQNFITTTNGKF
jgi:hypothetical protein